MGGFGPSVMLSDAENPRHWSKLEKRFLSWQTVRSAQKAVKENFIR